MAYIPQTQGLESYGFYNPSMQGPDWGRGIGYFLGQLAERQETRGQEEEDKRRWEQEQEIEMRRQGVWEKQIEAQMQPGEPPGAGNIAILKERYDQLIAKGHDPKQAAEWVYGPGRAPQPKAVAGTAAKDHQKNVMNFAKDTRERYEKEVKRLQDRADDIVKDGGDPSSLTPTIQNLQRAADYVAQLEAEIRQSGQVTGNQMNTLRELAGGMHKMKEGFLPSQQMPGPGGPAPEGPPMGAGAPQSEAPPEAGPGGMEDFISQLPPDVQAVIQELGLTPEQVQMALMLLMAGGQQEKK